MAKYRLRYSFDPGAGICLWAANDAAREQFDYPVDVRDLPLPENTRRRVWYVSAWFDTSIDWDYPPAPSPWSWEEREWFNSEAQKLLTLVREQLGLEFEVIDGSGTAGPA
ncbi:MAG TPA: hypothetical protein VIQ24_16820 [Pyrinomonadaceae bacterium]